MTAPEQDVDIDVADVIAEMDELGRAKWEAALARVQVKVLQKQLADARNDTAKAATPPLHVANDA